MAENIANSAGPETELDAATVIYTEDFCPFVFRWGGRLNSLGMLLVFLPPIVLNFMGYLPDWAAFFSACAIMMPLVASAAFTEPFSYFPTLGPAGAYLGYLSGNCSNLRLPCSIVAQQAAKVEQGTAEGSIISTIGVAISVLVSLAILTLGAIGGSTIVGLLPEKVIIALNLMLPALFAAILASSVASKPKFAAIVIPIALVIKLLQKYGLLAFIPATLLSAIVPLILAFGSMFLAVVLYKKNKLN